MKRFNLVVLLAAAATSIPMIGASAAEQPVRSVPMTVTYVGCSHGQAIIVQVQIPTGRFYVGPPSNARCVTGR